MSALKEQFTTKIASELTKELSLSSRLEAPTPEKITINVGLSSKRDAKFIETILETLRRISGQEPVKTKARKSESGFKIREGMVIGAKVTLRGERMWSFIDKLVHVAFPRVRDFRGIEKKAIDRAGNFSYGFKEHIAFPEISSDEIESLHGLQVTITTSATNREQGMALFKALGFPFKKEAK